MIRIKFYNSIAEAELTKNLLKEHGIQSTVNRKGIEFPGDMGDSYGADLLVSPKDLEKVKQII